VFFVACAIIVFFVLPAASIWLGVDSRDRNPRPAQW
jgi:hypothetical protein